MTRDWSWDPFADGSLRHWLRNWVHRCSAGGGECGGYSVVVVAVASAGDG